MSSTTLEPCLLWANTKAFSPLWGRDFPNVPNLPGEKKIEETENSIHIPSLVLHLSYPVIIIINNKHGDVRKMIDFYMDFVQK